MSSVEHLVPCNLELKRVGPINIRWNLLDMCASALNERTARGTVRLSFLWVMLMSFGIYIVGYIVYIVGMVIVGAMLSAPTQWIVVGALCLTGMAIVHGVTATRQKDAPS